MTPLAITTLLHCYTSPESVPNARAPAVKKIIIMLIRERMILPVQGVGDVYVTTERGAAHIVNLCQILFPRNQWVDNEGRAINLGWRAEQTTGPDSMEELAARSYKEGKEPPH